VSAALRATVALVLLAAGLGAGYWWGQREAARPVAGAVHAPAAAAEGGGTVARKILYYRNPMGLPDTSPVPKKDPMGMDYVPVYEGEAPDSDRGQVAISPGKVQKLGVRSEPATLRALDKVVAAAGRIEVDERRVFAVAPKFEGWVEGLFVNATGQPVSKGQPLFEVYSPELVSAQREYAIASQAVEALRGAEPDPRASMQRLAESSLSRLRNWDISDEQVRLLAQSGEAKRTLTFRSPVSGIVMEKKAVQGMRFMPGDTLYQIADLSSVWVIAEVYEQDIAMVRAGTRATVRVDAYPDRKFEGRITYVYPTLKPETRTVAVRLEIANPGLLLKPAMFAKVELPAGGGGKVLAVPVSAVIDSGTRQIVLVQRGEGRFEPREVKLGERTDRYVQILQGVQEGEEVVVSANFLIDAESNLKAAVGAFGHAAHGKGAGTAGDTASTVPPAAPKGAAPAHAGH
jgi:Cu(I)/Ag(I) efflux system membrane fusion protein